METRIAHTHHSALWPALIVVLSLLLVAPAFGVTQIGTCGYLISASGSYALSNDLVCEGVGVMVAASNVDLNLNGHTITNVLSLDVGVITATSDPFNPFIGADFSSCKTVTAVRIHGGAVKGFSEGVVLCSPNAQNGGASITMGVQVDHVIAQGNANTGIAVWSSGGNYVHDNFVSQNGSIGIDVEHANANFIFKNLVDGNATGGLLMGTSNSNLVTVNTFTNNTGWGMEVSGSKSNTISNNFFTDVGGQNLALGIFMGPSNSGNTLTGNTAFYSISFDMADGLPCGVNTWSNNFFGSKFGCIQ